MSRWTDLSLVRRLAIPLVLLLTPVVAFLLIAAAMTADAGLGGWFAIVVLPLSLLGAGLYLMAERPGRGRSGAEKA